ncbi:MAG TPA: thioredoxin domain-containing protein [Gemmatimonadales bacterium]|jgi:protein-disulfide isomerase|nr:thioredoxin domain-containing protein [Gemmatimonadales bacterium]
MNRFYLMLGVLTLALGAMLVYLLKSNPSAPRAATEAPATVLDDGFRGFTLGSDSAKVEVTEYSDFECPFCASFATVQMPTIREQLISTGKVRWRYRDFPLPVHKYSRYAAHAAQCAGEQGKFWEMHDQLFFNHRWAQTGQNPTGLFRGFATAAGVDLGRYDTCMSAGRFASRIEFSRQEGLQRNVNGTPTFFVNGTELRTGSRMPGSDDFKRLADSLAARRK